MLDIQKSLNLLTGSILGAAAAGAKLGQKFSPKKSAQKPEAKQPEVGSSLGYTTELSSDQAALMAFKSADEMIKQKARKQQLRDAKTGRYVRLYQAPEDKKEGGSK